MARKLRRPPPDMLTDAERVHAYRVGLRARAAITQCLTEMRKGWVRFWIGGPGEEVHGAATALAMHRFDRELGKTAGEWATALFPHYRSDGLVSMLAELRGHPDFTRDYFRQALARATDPMSRGRQMVMHACAPEYGIMPAQSPLGMNLGKAAGYAKGLVASGRVGAALAVCGDGTTGTSDFHETFTAASVWGLPLVVMITDNEQAISVTPEEGRGIKDFAAYAKAFGAHHLECDGSNLDDTYARTLEALRWTHEKGRPALVHARVPRLRGHSSSDGAVFCYDVPDPLVGLGESLCAGGAIDPEALFQPKPDPKGHDYFEDYELGRYMEAELATMRATLEKVRREPAPQPGDEYTFAHPPYPAVVEPVSSGTSAVQINEALNLCLHRMMAEGNSMAWGQDIAREKGGVFKVTRGLSEKYPKHVMNAPINEPLIMGTAVGAAHHQEMRVFPEIQFGDYSLNTLHWMVHAGNIYWGSGGNVHINITLRTPVDPVPGGALYHSMAVDGFFTPVQGWVIACPSTTFDAYGLLRTSGDYQGPVMILEPKVLYRRALGLRLPGEPPAPALKRARRESGESLLCADDLSSIADYRIPFGKGVVRREGTDVTIVTYGNTVHLAEQAATILAREDGIEAAIIDLRTLSPWDKDLVLESARATGRLLVAHQASTFAGFGREVQGSVHEEIDGLRSVTIGMRNVPAVASARELEEHTILGPRRIMLAARELCRRPEGAFVANENSWLQFAPTRRTS